MTTEWAYRQMALAGRVGFIALKQIVAWRAARRERCRLNCRVEEVVDETCPQYEDRFLCVRISGCIPTPEDNIDTDIRLELFDITDGTGNPEPVLAASSQWHYPDSPVFVYQSHNGVVPCRNAVLAGEVLVAKIPLHLLRFARRGRRKIQVVASILTRPDEQVLVCAKNTIEYVFYSDGFIELQERRENVLRASVELACGVIAELPYIPSVTDFIGNWINDKTRLFTPRTDIAEPLKRLRAAPDQIDVGAACEGVLAWGQKADRITSMDLALQVMAMYPSLPARQEEMLWEIAETLQIPKDRFLALCQKSLLTDNCPYERWRLLMGIREEILSENLRQRLNEEYRKWNARVTHPDPQIRRQADIILTLVAEVRNRMQKAVLSS